MAVWTVPAIIRRIVDGDTFDADLDLGWRTWRMAQRIRLLGLYAPELRQPGGAEAKAALVELLPLGAIVTIRSHALDAFGRVLATVETAEGRDISSAMIGAGHGTAEKSS